MQLWRKAVSLITVTLSVLSLSLFIQPAPTASASQCLDPNIPYGDIGAWYRREGGLNAYGCPLDFEHDYAGGRTQNYKYGQIWWKDWGGGHILTWGAFQVKNPGPANTRGRIHVNWLENADRDFYQVHYSGDLPEGGVQSNTDDGPVFFNAPGPNKVVRISLQGCIKDGLLGWEGSHCLGWLASIVVVTAPETQVDQPPRAPTINVTRTNSSGFLVSGSDFVPNHVVHIRVVDDFLHYRQFDQSSLSNGTLQVQLPNICTGSGPIHFSANDERPNSADLTGTLWSNTSTTSCP